MKKIVRYEGVTLENQPKPGDIIFLPEDQEFSEGQGLFLVLNKHEGERSTFTVFSLEKKYKGILTITHFSSWCFFKRLNVNPA
jgi:hypothetical protein